MGYDLSLMTVGAHPDDEGSSMGLLAKYAEMGGRGYVVCATRGDGVDAKIQDNICTQEELGRVRVEELRCACAKLGIEPPVLLDYQDGEVAKVDRDDAARKLARIIRKLRPTIVMTHGPEGGYGHPDHIAVSWFTTEGVRLAGDPSVDLGLEPFRPAKLYYSAWPRSYLEQVPAFRDRRADIGDQQLGFVGVPDETITTEIDIRPWMDKKMGAIACHRTQFEMDAETGRPKTFNRGLPEEQALQFFGFERFVLADTIVPVNGRETDLFTGVKLEAKETDRI